MVAISAANRGGLASTSRPASAAINRALLRSHHAILARRTRLRTAAAADSNRQLLSAVVKQVRKETLPWVADLVLPLLGRGDAELSLPPTVPPQQLADPDSRFLTVDGVSLHYKERSATRAGAPTILLLHGFNGSTFSWRTTMDEVAAATGCRVLCFDRPPFGLTERPLEWGRPGQALQYNPYELAGSVNLLEGLLARLGIDQVVAVGHSAGAPVALELQRRQPGLVAALGLVAPAVPTTPENSFARRATLGSQLRFALARAVLQSDGPGLRYVRRQLLRRRDEVAAGKLGFTPRPPAADADSSPPSISSADASRTELGVEDDAPAAAETQSGAAAVADDVIEGYLKPLRADNWDRGALLNLRAFSLPAAFDYDAVAAPVLVVQGAHDGGLTRNADALVELLRRRPGGAVTEFKSLDCGHVPMDEMPDAFNASLVDFVRRVVLGGAVPAAAPAAAALPAVE